MTEKEKIEGNILIANFMGATHKKGKESKKDIYSFLKNISFCEVLAIQTHDGEYMFYKNELLFHSSWDWLMPVYHKIRMLYKELATSQKIHWGRRSGKVVRQMIDYDIAEVFKAIVDAIKWYNSQNKPSS